VAEANARLAASRSARRVRLIPAAEAVAALADRAGQPGGLAGITGRSIGETLRTLFIDDVHLTPLGTYYTALISHHALNGPHAEARWSPGIDPVAARSLQQFAREFMQNWRERPLAREVCRGYLATSYLPQYLAYVRDTQWRQQGLVRAYLRWLRHLVRWRLLLRSGSPRNPFHHDDLVARTSTT